MSKKEFVTMFVLLSLSTKSNLAPTEDVIKDAVDAWDLLQNTEDL